MLNHCLKSRKNAKVKNPIALKTKNGTIIFLLKCAVLDSKKLRFIKNQETSKLLSNLPLKSNLSKIPVFRDSSKRNKMNEIINKYLVAGDTFMPEMYLRQPAFTYIACEPFIKNKEIIQTFKESCVSRYIYQKELGKGCF